MCFHVTEENVHHLLWVESSFEGGKIIHRSSFGLREALHRMIWGHFSVDMKILQHTFCLVLFQAWIDDALEYCMHSSSN